jgi:hypothetical protein
MILIGILHIEEEDKYNHENIGKNISTRVDEQMRIGKE